MSGSDRASARAGRATLFVAALLFAGADLAVKAWAQEVLQGNPIDASPVGLRLAYNPGVAFSLGTSFPAEVLVIVTAVITGAIALFAWRAVRGLTLLCQIAVAAVLGGALANLIDRAADGLVTDYLHTGWWPTFNLADTFIVVGAISLVAHDFLRMGKSRNGSDEQLTQRSAT